MIKIKLCFICVICFIQLAHGEGFIINNYLTNYHLSLGNRGYSLIISKDDQISNMNITNVIIKSPGYEMDYFIELGVADYNKQIIMFFSLASDPFPVLTLYQYNFKHRNLNKVIIFSNSKPYLIFSDNKGKKIIINFWNYGLKKALTIVYNVIRDSQGNIQLQPIKEFADLSGIENINSFFEKYDPVENKLYFYKENRKFFEIFSINLNNEILSLENKIAKNENEKIYLLNARRTNILILKYQPNGYKNYEVYDRENKLIFNKKISDTNQKISMNLNNMGNELLELERNSNFINLSKYMLSSKKRIAIQLNSDFINYASSNKYISFSRNSFTNISLGKYSFMEKSNIIVKKKCRTCP